MEKRGASLSVGSGCQPGVARRRLGGPHELGEGVDVIVRVLRTDYVWVVIAARSVGNVITQGRNFTRVEPVGNAHFVQVSPACESEQAGILIFPTEATYAKSAAGFGNRYKRYLALHAARLA